MIARLLTFLSVVFELPSIPARESRNGAENKQKRKPRQLAQKQNNEDRPQHLQRLRNRCNQILFVNFC